MRSCSVRNNIHTHWAGAQVVHTLQTIAAEFSATQFFLDLSGPFFKLRRTDSVACPVARTAVASSLSSLGNEMTRPLACTSGHHGYAPADQGNPTPALAATGEGVSLFCAHVRDLYRDATGGIETGISTSNARGAAPRRALLQ